ncbi:ShlB/FhaC/HecB family hemolysin secretion/activation protein [Luteolibacter luteus]|uniref:ShlB/FhaC/HecB family hemolysin secretion/activation protein n=1 Tax=Luteolibacter luteus TaxID=2728835 RepID=A0A858RRC8_9BACT|nr:ShlB/FhaC/HecB family hemolysin secretion/activation protein [Luteolibacter luteus]
MVALGILLGVAGQLPASTPQQSTLLIREYRVQGSTLLTPLEIEEAVYPYLGPGRTADDVEQARAALEKVFRDKGYQTVTVQIPVQDPRSGVIRLQVVEGKIGRLRVTGAKYFLPSRIKEEAPSLAEGSVPDFAKVKAEIIALNRLPDRTVKPQLRAGVEPGTYDVDLEVEDKSPLHGSLEVNNRYSPNTTQTRLNGAISYGNLFQKGHTLGLDFQVAPENPDDALVFSGYYLARVSDKVSLMLQATKQDSDISTLGGSAVAGRGEILGLRALFDLPGTDSFYQTFSLGMDWKSYDDRTIGGFTFETPIEYFPVSANYGASWVKKNSFTQANLSLNFHLRGMGGDQAEFDGKRYQADGSFIYLRGDLSHTRDLNDGSQLFGKLQGQVSSQPLVNSEQISGGGLGNARGYLEATALGDSGIFATAEYRTRSFIGKKDEKGKQADEWRIHAFVDAGTLNVMKPLPSQKSFFNFLSAGAGTRFRLREHYNGSLDIGVPFTTQADAESGEVRVTFRGWAEF